MHEFGIVNGQLLLFSTAPTALVQEHVRKVLADLQFCHGDQKITDFQDPFLKQNVADISVCDTEHGNRKKEVRQRTIDLLESVFQIFVFG